MEDNFVQSNITNGSFSDNKTLDDDAWVHQFIFVNEAYVQPITLGLGILTNIFNLVILSKIRLTQLFRTVLIALAISDVLACTCGFLQIVLEVVFYRGDVPFGYWELEAVTNYGLYYLFAMFLCTSATIVVMFTAIRNLLVTKPLTAKKYLAIPRVKLFCFLCFLSTALLYLPTSLNVLWQGCYKSINTTEICTRLFEEIPNLERISNAYLFSLTVVYGPVLLVVYIICIILIQCSLKKSNKFLESMGSVNNRGRTTINCSYIKKRTVQNARLTRTLFSILLLDSICIVPTICYGIGLLTTPQDTIFNTGEEKSGLLILDVVAEEFLNIRPLYNFWVYCFTQKEFRDCVLRITGLIRVKRRLQLRTTKRQSSCEAELCRSSVRDSAFFHSIDSPSPGADNPSLVMGDEKDTGTNGYM